MIEKQLESEFYFHADQADVSFYGKKELFGAKASKRFARAIPDSRDHVFERLHQCFKGDLWM